VGCNPPLGPKNYLDLLRRVHAGIGANWYLEIGTRSGRSLALARCASIAIDPEFQLKGDVIGDKPALHLFQETSDAAFANPRLQALQAEVDIAFLDGLHHFEVLLRDVINTEKMMSADGVIFLHDTAPRDAAMTTRTLPAPGDTTPWTGDVWKLVQILQRHRPDLDVIQLDCRPTGLAMITGPWGGSDALSAHHDDIVAEWMDIELDTYGAERFYGESPLVPAALLLAQLAAAEI
jgi:hypothetical protein